jgi:hypothetical protein
MADRLTLAQSDPCAANSNFTLEYVVSSSFFNSILTELVSWCIGV